LACGTAEEHRGAGMGVARKCHARGRINSRTRR
jgi:hypothetical protein